MAGAHKGSGQVRPRGILVVEDLTDGTIIQGGENVAPFEVEDILAQGDVWEAAVSARPGEDGTSVLSTFVARRYWPAPESEVVRDWYGTVCAGRRPWPTRRP